MDLISSQIRQKDKEVSSVRIQIQMCLCSFKVMFILTTLFWVLYSVCKGGHWSCISLPCSGVCNIDGGFHITTFDNKRFNFHGNCHYVLAKVGTNSHLTPESHE